MKCWLRKRWGLTLSLALYVFAVMVAAMLTAGLLLIVLSRTGVIDLGLNLSEANFAVFRTLFTMIGFSMMVGVGLTAFFSRRVLKPVLRLIDATRQIAQGDFSVSVESKGIHGIHELEELAYSFNQMARELASIETLRSDFINNFSHEFKTPIVSIRGFAKLLKENDLTAAEKQEYLDIIITESKRLSELSTNVLTLSKYESIAIISEKAPFRVDEQLRRAILLTEPKWQKKDLDIHIEMDEIVFNGNENLTQQIWINFLDNAIKFSRPSGMVDIRLMDLDESICFSIQDEGVGMNEETQLRIFDKFYQGDKSHNQSGNGLGLTMVKRIVDLHGGTIQVDSSLGVGSVLTVILPK